MMNIIITKEEEEEEEEEEEGGLEMHQKPHYIILKTTHSPMETKSKKPVYTFFGCFSPTFKMCSSIILIFFHQRHDHINNKTNIYIYIYIIILQF